MPRVKRGTMHLKTRKNLLKKVKGYKWGRKSKIKLAKVAVLKAGASAYRDRKNKKRTFRALWQIKISSALKQYGISYSKFMGLSKNKNLEVAQFLESLVHERHTIKSLEDKINSEFNSNIKFELCNDDDNDEDTKTDFNLIGVLEFKDVFCDVDVYYLPMRYNGFDGANILITEVGYEFQ